MTAAVALVSLLLAFPVETIKPDTRPRHAFAPSLPQLTNEEEEKLDEIIDRFILYDIGKLKGQAGKQALLDFQRLGPEATFALIRGLNRAAAIEASCPAVVIGKKLRSILGSSLDEQLLDFARENIGAGVGRTRHIVTIKDLRTVCITQKRVIFQREQAILKFLASKSPGEMTLAQLHRLTELLKDKKRLQPIVEELARRGGAEALGSLANVAASYDPKARALGQEYLGKTLDGLDADGLKKSLKDARPIIRGLAAQTIGKKKLPLGAELIELLADRNSFPQQSARKALKTLAGDDTDFGPEPNSTSASVDVAIGLWREWWAKKSSN